MTSYLKITLAMSLLAITIVGHTQRLDFDGSTLQNLVAKDEYWFRMARTGVDALSIIPLAGELWSFSENREITEEGFYKLINLFTESGENLRGYTKELENKVDRFFKSGVNGSEPYRREHLAEIYTTYADLMNSVDKVIEESSGSLSEGSLNYLSTLKTKVRESMYSNLPNHIVNLIDAELDAKLQKQELNHESFVQVLKKYVDDTIESNIQELSKQFTPTEFEQKKQKLNEFKQFSVGIANVISLVDEDLALDVYSASTHGIDLAIGVTILTDVFTNGNSLSSAALSTTALSGYGMIFTAGVSLINHFGSNTTRRSESEIIIEYLSYISSQIDALSRLTGKGFERLEGKLLIIHKSILENFEVLFSEIEDLEKLILILRQDVKRVENLLEYNIGLEQARAVEKHHEEFKEICKDCIVFENGNDNIEKLKRRDLLECQDKFAGWANNTVTNTDLTGNIESFKETSRVIYNYFDGGFDYNINSFGKFLMERRTFPEGDRLPNPLLWKYGFDGYKILSERHRWYKNDSHLNNFNASEQRLIAFYESIRADTSLFEDILQTYNNRLQSIRDRLLNKHRLNQREQHESYIQKLKKLKIQLEHEVGYPYDNSLLPNLGSTIIKTANKQLSLVNLELSKFDSLLITDSFNWTFTPKYIVIEPYPNNSERAQQLLLIDKSEVIEIVKDTALSNYVNLFDNMEILYHVKFEYSEELRRMFDLPMNTDVISLHFEMLDNSGFQCNRIDGSLGRCILYQPHVRFSEISFTIKIDDETVAIRSTRGLNLDNMMPYVDAGLNKNIYFRSQFAKQYYSLPGYDSSITLNPNTPVYRDRGMTNFSIINYSYNPRRLLRDGEMEDEGYYYKIKELSKKVPEITKDRLTRQYQENQSSLAEVIFKDNEHGEDLYSLNVYRKLIEGFVYFGYHEYYNNDPDLFKIFHSSRSLSSGFDIQLVLSKMASISNPSYETEIDLQSIRGGHFLLDEYFTNLFENLETSKSVLQSLTKR